MLKKLIFITLLVLLTQANLRLLPIISGQGIFLEGIDYEAPASVPNKIVPPPTQQAFVYNGTLQVTINDPQAKTISLVSLIASSDNGSSEATVIDNGYTQTISFSATIIPSTEKCTAVKCFYGWINQYQLDLQEPFAGNGNSQLKVQPYFSLSYTTEKNFALVYDPNLDQVWIQIIEIVSEKFNPLAYSTPTTTNGLQPGFSLHKVQDSELSDILNHQNLRGTSILIGNTLFPLSALNKGDTVGQLSKTVDLLQFSSRSSALSESLIVNSGNVLKRRTLNYDVILNGDQDYKINDNPQNGQNDQNNSSKPINLDGSVKIYLLLDSTKKVLVSDVGLAQSYLLSNGKSFLPSQISERRARLVELQNKLLVNQDFETIATQLRQGPEDLPKLDLISEFSSPSHKQEDESITQAFINSDNGQSVFSTKIVSDPSVIIVNPKKNLRLLTTLDNNVTIYSNTKNLLSQTIFGKSFSVSIDVYCFFLQYSDNHHQLQCRGNLNYQLFGKTKSINIFNWQKPTDYKWNYSKTYSGKWDFSIGIGLPQPIDFISFTFNFHVDYSINLSIQTTTAGWNPYNIKVKTIADAQVKTNSKAGLRLVVIEGGVFINGILASLKTDPTITLSYYFSQNKIIVNTQWYLYINAFNFDWGFYYKNWTFLGGWSSDKIIKKWTVNAVYKQILLVSSVKTINL